jgi:hypothetical protein
MDRSSLSPGARVVYYRTQGGGRNPVLSPATVVRVGTGSRVQVDAEFRDGPRRVWVAAENLEATRGG